MKKAKKIGNAENHLRKDEKTKKGMGNHHKRNGKKKKKQESKQNIEIGKVTVIEIEGATETEIDETHVLKFWPTSAKFILFSTILFTIQ